MHSIRFGILMLTIDSLIEIQRCLLSVLDSIGRYYRARLFIVQRLSHVISSPCQVHRISLQSTFLRSIYTDRGSVESRTYEHPC